jgi:hypothetical protein
MARRLKVVDEEPELEQGTIHPDFEIPRNPKIEKLANRYRKLMLERKAAGEEECEAHDELLKAMIAEGLDHYEFKNLTVHVNETQKCKVKNKGAEADADD